MVDTTPRHGLELPAYRSERSDIPLRANASAVDARLPWSCTGDPNGVFEGLYVGQRLYAVDTNRDWVCKSVGPAVAIADPVTPAAVWVQPDNEFIAVLDMLINTKYLDFIKHLKNAKLHNSRADRVSGGGGGSEEDQQRSDTGSGGESETVS